MSVCLSDTKTPKQLKIIHFTLPQHLPPLTPTHTTAVITTLHLSADFGTARYPHLADTCILLYRPVSSTHKHSKNNYCCDECGIVKDTRKKLQDHQRSHKTGICYKSAKTISCQNMPKHLKICKGVREKEMGKV